MNTKGIILVFVVIIVVAVLAMFFLGREDVAPNSLISTSTPNTTQMQENPPVVSPVAVTPISHASAVLVWDAQVLYTDPVGEDDLFADVPEPDLILLTDIHGDHLSTSTLQTVTASGTQIIAPQAVADLLPQALLDRTTILENGATTTIAGFFIEAIPMYNLPESDDSRHVKGRGNGYVIEREGTRVYVAGDTADIPEMRGLQNIDVAFVPMNPPFTMSVETAADAVLDFAPRIVYPFHYRGQDGLNDIERFRDLVNIGNPDITVVLLDWYPEG